MSKFKVWDRVKCIDNDNGELDLLKIGEIYTVLQIRESMNFIDIGVGSSSGWDSRRFELVESTNDMVNHPKHYINGKFEVVEIIEAFNLGFHLANLLKYVLRAGKKDPSKELEDLYKAQWYLNRHIKNLVDKQTKEG